MSENEKQAKKPFFPEGNFDFPKLSGDPNHQRYYAALEKAGFTNGWIEIRQLLDAATTKEEEAAIRRRIPIKPLAAVYKKKRLGKEAFLARGYNLDYANGELGGPDWMDKY